MPDTPVAHLHVHTSHSVLDGLAKAPDLVASAVADGQPALAITDHGNLDGTFEFYREATKAGIVPILGMEAYLAIGSRWERNVLTVPAEEDYDGSDTAVGTTKQKWYEHLTMLASTRTGWANLVRLNNMSQDPDTTWYKPRLDYDDLGGTVDGRRLSDGIIVGTGCLGGPVAGALARGNLSAARANLAKLVDIFGAGQVFVEVMDHGIPAERRVIPALVQLAREFGLLVVATNDSHYVSPDDAHAHDIWLCTSQKRGAKTVQLSDPNRFRFSGSGFHLRTAAQMHALFDGQPGTELAVANTLLVAQQCEPGILDDLRTRLPNVVVPPQFADQASYLHEKIRRGAVDRYGEIVDGGLSIPGPVKARLRHEEDVIVSKGYPGYFLAVDDYITWARSDRGVPTEDFPDGEPGKKAPIGVGAGRGSGAGSAALYCLGVTNIEPMSNGLLFERFLDPERTDFPDVDTDFEAGRRDEVIRYAVARYGKDRVARIGTHGVAWAKNSIKSVARVMGLPKVGERAAATIPGAGKASDVSLAWLLDSENSMGSALRALVAADDDVADVVKIAERIEGVVSNVSTHACGVVISDDPLLDLVPMRVEKLDDGSPVWVTAWDKDAVETFGLVKFDFLAIEDLDVVSAAVTSIDRRTGVAVDPSVLKVDPDDPKVAAAFDLLASGRTAGVFQMASSGMTELVRKVRPSSLSELAAVVALYRPGPMGEGMHERYPARKFGLEPVDYGIFTKDPAEQEVIAAVLADTYGVIVYQEQLQRLARYVADVSPSVGNQLRKAFSKKDRDKMDAAWPAFRDGGMRAVRSDGTPKVAFAERTLEALWRTFAASAEYLFNASHSFAYAYLSFVMAYLKANWNTDFGGALLATTDKEHKRRAVLRDLLAEGVVVRGPDINVSVLNTAVSADGVVRFGLSEIKGVGKHAASIIAERERGGPYVSLYDLLARVQVTDESGAVRNLPLNLVEALVEAGACDAFGPRLGQLMVVRAGRVPSPPQVPDAEFGVLERSARERERLMVAVGDHPLVSLRSQVSSWTGPDGRTKAVPVQLIPKTEGVYVSTIGVVASWTERTISGGRMANVVLEGSHGEVSCVVWPRTFREVETVPSVGDLVGVTGKVTVKAPYGVDEEATVEQSVVEIVVTRLWSGPLDDPGRSPQPGSFPALVPSSPAPDEDTDAPDAPPEPQDEPGRPEEPADDQEPPEAAREPQEAAQGPIGAVLVVKVRRSRADGVPVTRLRTALRPHYSTLKVRFPGLDELERWWATATIGDQSPPVAAVFGRRDVLVIEAAGASDQSTLEFLAKTGMPAA